ncbi:hypothetical protein [Alloalcanivorax mobilis]|uniref:hypothetical protein n=1 Tax=Alloalcanivorax mobilis TaxID=2019569 RepID=UPI000C76D5ED|nr:hypothetical protein [Alloalcanivorax mobilis]|tara:strand:- start:15776 stop:16222 length:447 start_codon:yes stop_codon:yes gene_type:complete
MNLDVQHYLMAIKATLRDEILEALPSAHAQGQVRAIIDVLDKIQAMADWSPAMLEEQIDALKAGQARLSELAQGLAGPVIEPPTQGADMASRLASYRRGIDVWIDWFYNTADIEDPQRRRRIEMAIRDVLQAWLAAERRRIAAVDFPP